MGAIYNIELREGVKVAMLFTPRLYEFKGSEGVTFDYVKGNQASVHALYADIMYCAALNHWTLTHSGEVEFPYKRIEFHEFSATNPKSFGKALIFAMEALSGKSVRELIEDAKKSQEMGKESQSASEGAEEVKKKSPRGWITRLLRRS
jgi:hypothetical protein